MKSDTRADSELVTAATAGDQDAFRELVLRYQKPVFGLVLRMVRDRGHAEDLAQEAFVKAYRHLATFQLERKFSSWLFKIAHNTTIDFLRRHQMATVPLESSSHDDDSTWETLSTPDSDSPERIAARNQLVAQVEAAIEKMSPLYREALTLRFQHGMSYGEIAEVTGLPMGTVKVHIFRARKQLVEEITRFRTQQCEVRETQSKPPA